MTEISDRELDIYIAEHLFGISSDVARLLSDGPTLIYYSATGDGMLFVLEAMCGRGWGCELIARPQGKWSAEFSKYPDGSTALCGPLPRAVAEAAKAALEGEP